MTKGMSIFIAALAVIQLILGIQACCTDVIDLQKMGINYHDALIIEADNNITGLYMICASFIASGFAWLLFKMR